jgi:Ca2+/Na+ antiporter
MFFCCFWKVVLFFFGVKQNYQLMKSCIVNLWLNAVYVLNCFFFFLMYFLCVAFLIKFKWGNNGEVESQQVSTMEDNNNRGKFFRSHAQFFDFFMLIIVHCYKVLRFVGNREIHQDIKFFFLCLRFYCESNCDNMDHIFFWY